MTKRNRIEVIDWMRGIGALWVGLFHFTGGDTGWMAYAYPVLMTFFVASGLAIPYAMWPRYGGFSDAPVFMLRRLTRLEPPYFVAILVAVGLGFLSSIAPGFHGEPIHVTPIQFLLHFGYLNDVFDQPWLNPVFWTLAIEFQFYVLMILLYGGLSDRRRLVRYATLAVMAVFAITVPSEILVFRYLSLFALGAVGFQYRVGLIGKREFLLLTAALLLVTAMTIGIPEAMTAAVVGLIGALANPPSVPFLSTLGLLSYSFYLVHVPIGGRIINLAKRLHYTAPVELAAVVLAMAASLGAAYLLHRFVERPAQNYSGRFKYGGAKPASRAMAPPALVPAE